MVLNIHIKPTIYLYPIKLDMRTLILYNTQVLKLLRIFMNKTNIFVTLFATVIGLTVMAVSAGTVFADGCTTQYGGGQYGTNCPPTEIVVNKEVGKPADKGGDVVFVENLSSSDPTFVPGNEVRFRITVTNKSNRDFTNVKVTDVFPPYVSYVSGGPSGTSYDPATRTLVFTIDKLTPNENRTFVIVGKVAEANAFPSGKNTFCVNNVAKIEVDDRRGEDTAQLCIQSNVLGATTLPKAGFEDLLYLIPFAATGFTGIALLKKRG